jgi:hypothetical protein
MRQCVRAAAVPAATHPACRSLCRVANVPPTTTLLFDRSWPVAPPNLPLRPTRHLRVPVSRAPGSVRAGAAQPNGRLGRLVPRARAVLRPVPAMNDVPAGWPRAALLVGWRHLRARREAQDRSASAAPAAAEPSCASACRRCPRPTPAPAARCCMRPPPAHGAAARSVVEMPHVTPSTWRAANRADRRWRQGLHRPDRLDPVADRRV